MLFTKVLKRFCGNWLFTLNASNLDSLSKKRLDKDDDHDTMAKKDKFPNTRKELEA